jgi:hypothetical protein
MDFILPKLDNPSGWFSCFCVPLSIVNLRHLVDFSLSAIRVPRPHSDVAEMRRDCRLYNHQ